MYHSDFWLHVYEWPLNDMIQNSNYFPFIARGGKKPNKSIPKPPKNLTLAYNLPYRYFEVCQ